MTVMTVRELIEELKKQPQDLPVTVTVDWTGAVGEIMHRPAQYTSDGEFLNPECIDICSI